MGSNDEDLSVCLAENKKISSHAGKIMTTLDNTYSSGTPLKEINCNANHTPAGSTYCKDSAQLKKSVSKKSRTPVPKNSSSKLKKSSRLSALCARKVLSVGNKSHDSPRAEKLKKYASKVYFDFEEGFKQKSVITNLVLTKPGVKLGDQIENKETKLEELKSDDQLMNCESGNYNVKFKNSEFAISGQCTHFVNLESNHELEEVRAQRAKSVSGDLLKGECAELAVSDYEDQCNIEVMMVKEPEVLEKKFAEPATFDYKDQSSSEETVVTKSESGVEFSEIVQILKSPNDVYFESRVGLGIPLMKEVSDSGNLFYQNSAEMFKSPSLVHLGFDHESGSDITLRNDVLSKTSDQYSRDVSLITHLLKGYCFESQNARNLKLSRETILLRNAKLEQTNADSESEEKFITNERRDEETVLLISNLEESSEKFLTEKHSLNLTSDDVIKQANVKTDAIQDTINLSYVATESTNGNINTTSDLVENNFTSGALESSLTENIVTKLRFKETKASDDATVLDFRGGLSTDDVSNFDVTKVDSTNDGANLSSTVDRESANNRVLNVALINSINKEASESLIERKTASKCANNATNLSMIKLESTEGTNFAVGDTKITNEAISGILKKNDSTLTDVVASSFFAGKFWKVFDCMPSVVKSLFCLATGNSKLSEQIPIIGQKDECSKKLPPLSAARKRKYSLLVKSLKRRPLSDYKKTYCPYRKLLTPSKLVRSPLHNTEKK